MSEHLYEVGFSKITTGSAQGISESAPVALAAGKRPPEIREIGVFNSSGAAAEIGVGRPAAIGITPAGNVVNQAINGFDVVAGATSTYTSWGTSPTQPSPFMRRATLQSVIGAGVIWVWNPGEFVLWVGNAISTVVIFQIGTTAVTYDVYIKYAE